MTKKKSRRQKKQARAASPVDPNQRRKERLEQRRVAREEAEAARRRSERRERMIRGALIGALIAAGVWFFFLRGATPEAIAGHQLEKFSESGVNDHSPPASYPMTPPVTGPHAPNPAPCGIHGAPIPDENLVHTLEHGAVGVLYDPNAVAPEDIAEIESVVASFDDHTFSAPYEGMSSPIYVVSWGERMPLDSFDEDAVREYIDTFRNKGPERQDCPNTSEAPFAPQGTPTPSPSPTREGRNRDSEEEE